MEIAIIIALILLNGVFAMSEIALISARKSSLSNDIRHGSSTARIALKLANDPDKFLSTIQIGITLIGILTGIYSGDVLATDFGNILTDAGVPATYAYLLAQTLIVILVTYLTIIFGELVPKRIGIVPPPVLPSYWHVPCTGCPSSPLLLYGYLPKALHLSSTCCISTQRKKK